MKRLRLLFDLLSEVENNKQVERKVIIALSGAKFLIDNHMKYLIEVLNWYEGTYNTTSTKELFIKIYKETGQMIFIDDEVTNVLNKIPQELFRKVINSINEMQLNVDKIKLVEEYRRLLNLDPKLSIFSTPDSVLQVPVEMLEIEKGAKIVDSFNGESGVLLSIYKTVGKGISYFGQEKDKDTFLIGSFIAFILLNNDAEVKEADSFKESVAIKSGKVEKFDYAISAPPFYREKQMLNRYLLNEYKEINIQELRSYWVPALEGLSAINECGKSACLLPIGALFSIGPNDKAVKKYLLSNDFIEAIVRLPEKILAPYTSAQMIWIIFNKNKDVSRKNKIRYIKLDKYSEDIDRRNKCISNRGIKFAVDEYKDMTSNTEDSFDLNMIDIVENNYNLDGFELTKRKEIEMNVIKKNIVELKSIATIRRGVQIKKNRLDIINNEECRDHYIVSLSNIIDNEIVLDENSKIIAEDRWKELYELKEGDIVISTKSSTFKTAYVDQNINNAIITSNLTFIRVNRKKYDPIVLKYYLDSKQGRKVMNSLMKGTTAIKSISIKDLEGVLIPNIDIEKQLDIRNMILNSEEEYLIGISRLTEMYEEKKRSINRAMNLEI